MGYWFIYILLPLLQLAADSEAQNHSFEPMTVQLRMIDAGISDTSNGCAPKEKIQSAKVDILKEISDKAQSIHNIPNCGDGLWYRVAHLNMSDPSQQCPSTWRQITLSGERMCARPTSDGGSCPASIYPVRRHYRKVCGRVIGYQFGSTTSFQINQNQNMLTIDEAYLDGISITHGTPRSHIWSYAAGGSETGICNRCPCYNGVRAPSFVGDNYYCESAYSGNCFARDFLPDDPLWDGQQCDHEGTCCTGANTPPWFSVSLPDGTTSDDIEVRICHDQHTDDEDTPIQLLELYVQ